MQNVIRSRSITYLLTYKPRTGTPAAKLQRLHCQTSLTITGGYPGEILYKAAQEIVDQYLISKWSKIELQISIIISEAVYGHDVDRLDKLEPLALLTWCL